MTAAASPGHALPAGRTATAPDPTGARGRIVPLRPSADAAGLLARLRAVRADGGIPLVGDDRWAPELWRRVHRLCAAAPPHAGTGWAALTSGSSGAPRLVLRTAASWSASFAAVSSLLGARPGDVIALPAPPAASLTLFSLAHALEGGPVPALSGPAAPGGPGIGDATLFHGTPHALRALLDAGAPPALRTALVGGSGVDASLRERAGDRGIRVVAYYGAAELSFVAVDDGDGYTPLPGVETDVRDGLLRVRSPFTATGYLAEDAGGRPALRPLDSGDGWCTAGDRAARDGDRLRLLGRADGAILTASATVSPEDVEAALRPVPGVADVLVLGLPDERIGALVAAVVEPRPGHPVPTAAALRRAARERLAPAHRPRRWFTAELPRTASGKPARAEAARRVLSGEVDRLG